MSRSQRIYRLDIIYPEGSHEPGWRPVAYDDPKYLATLTHKQRREHFRRPFRWPRERQYLSSSGAYGRAHLLRLFGAEVEVLGSDPVTWPNLDDESQWWQYSTTAATWRPELEDHDTGDMPMPEAEFERRFGESAAAKVRQYR